MLIIYPDTSNIKPDAYNQSEVKTKVRSTNLTEFKLTKFLTARMEILMLL